MKRIAMSFGPRRLVNFAKTAGLLSLVFAFSLSLTGGVALAAPLNLPTSPILEALQDYSVLGGGSVTCTGATTISGEVGVSPGTSITGFPAPCHVSPGTTHSNDASAIAAQAEAQKAFGDLDQSCDLSFGAVDLTVTDFSAHGGGVGSVAPGVYCSTSSFSLSGTLTLLGAGPWIFKTASTLITAPGSKVIGGDPCLLWWRVGSSTTLDTTTSFQGNVFSQKGANAVNTGAKLLGKFIALSAVAVTLDANSISGPSCGQTTEGKGKGEGKGRGAISGLGNTGGAPIRNGDFPWSLVMVGGLSAMAVIFLGVRAYRRTYLRKQ